MTDRKALLAANAAFYEAFSTGDFEAMTRIWAEDDSVSCVHPGWPAIVGHAAVVSSWRDILRNASRPLVTCYDPREIIFGSDGRVLCIETVDSVHLAASNHFRRVDGVWRLIHHQSSHIVNFYNTEKAQTHSLPRRIH